MTDPTKPEQKPARWLLIVAGWIFEEHRFSDHAANGPISSMSCGLIVSSANTRG